jgi:hypothetical protein
LDRLAIEELNVRTVHEDGILILDPGHHHHPESAVVLSVRHQVTGPKNELSDIEGLPVAR